MVPLQFMIVQRDGVVCYKYLRRKYLFFRFTEKGINISILHIFFDSEINAKIHF